MITGKNHKTNRITSSTVCKIFSRVHNYEMSFYFLSFVNSCFTALRRLFLVRFVHFQNKFNYPFVC